MRVDPFMFSEQLWGTACNETCDAFIQIKWALFRIVMYRPTRYGLIFFPVVSAETRCFEISGGDKVACRACARIPEAIGIVNTERHRCDSLKVSVF